MKVAIATAVYHPQVNGVAVFSHNLAVGLVKRGVEVIVICPSQTGRSYTKLVDGVKVHYLRSVSVKVYPDQIHEIPEERRILGVKIPRIFYRHSFRASVFPQLEVTRILDEFCPDVVHIQVSDPIGLSVVSYAKRHQIPVVTTEHNQPEVFTEPLHVPRVVKKPVEELLNAYFVNRQSKSDFVTMPTEKAIRNLLMERGRDFGVPVAAVSNGVDLADFKPGRVSDAVKEKYELSKTAKTLLNVGRLDPEKNVGKVIEAFKLVKKRLSNIQLVIVGDGVDKANLESLAEGCPEVHFLGRVTPPELYEVYRLGDVFVTASEIETQGIVLIEAAATGMPLVAVDKGAVSEVCRDGENGYLCHPGDVNEIAEAAVKILSDDELRRRFSKVSIKIASEHDFEKTLDKFINIYNTVVAKAFDKGRQK